MRGGNQFTKLKNTASQKNLASQRDLQSSGQQYAKTAVTRRRRGRPKKANAVGDTVTNATEAALESSNSVLQCCTSVLVVGACVA